MTTSSALAELPVSARLAWWGTAWLRGQLGPDDLLDGVLADDVTHVVLTHDATTDASESVAGAAHAMVRSPSILTTLTELRARGATSFGATFPVDGDPVGLGGPREFTTAALEAGEAVVVEGTGCGLVPNRVGPTVEWHVLPAERRQLPDVGEADRELRAELPRAADRLADLDVARWRPEVADELMNLRRQPELVAPAGTPPRCIALAVRARTALTIVDLALADDGGALTVAEAERRRAALLPLARSARRALVAACSPEVWPPA